jgi:hypothetical protein
MRDALREIGTDLLDALAASDRDDWTTALAAVRMIHGRAVVTCRTLEGMSGPDVAPGRAAARARRPGGQTGDRRP